MAIFRQFSAYQSWQAPACLHFLHRDLHKILLIFSPMEFCRSRFSSGRGKTAVNPDGFTRILTKDRRKTARQNRVRIYSRLVKVKGVEPQSVFGGIFVPAHRQNPHEYVSIHSGFSSTRPKSTRHKLLRTEKEIIFKDFSVQRRSNPDGLRSTISRKKTEKDSLSAVVVRFPLP